MNDLELSREVMSRLSVEEQRAMIVMIGWFMIYGVAFGLFVPLLFEFCLWLVDSLVPARFWRWLAGKCRPKKEVER